MKTTERQREYQKRYDKVNREKIRQTARERWIKEKLKKQDVDFRLPSEREPQSNYLYFAELMP